MEAAAFIVVVVEQIVLITSLGGHGTSEGGQFPRINGRVELDRKKSKFCHWAAG